MHAWLAGLLAVQGLTCEVEAYRYWRAPDVTSVVAFVTVPLRGLTFLPDSAGATRTARYGVDVTLRDAAGTVLYTERSAERAVLGPLQSPGVAEAVLDLAFELKPGAYELRVAVTDSATAARAEARLPLVASAEPPRIGDLLLATGAGPAGAQPSRGTLVRGGTALAVSPRGRLPHGLAALLLYTEVYPPAHLADSVAVVRVEVRDARDGALRVETRPLGRRYPRGGGMELLRLPLEGLSPGGYTVRVRVEYPDTVAVVERAFTLRPPAPAPAASLEPRRFEDWEEYALDSLFRVAEYVATSQERELYPRLALDAKRRFMEEFWSRRDPTPGPPNEFYEEYSRRVAFANREFRARGLPEPGWASPRGRIYILYGPPVERIVRQVMGRAAVERPLEIWRYAGGRNDTYVFYDIAGNGLLALVYTTNPNEPSMPNWEDYFDSETLELIRRF